MAMLLDAKRAYLRRKYTSTKKMHFTEGWVEFKDKKVARSVAEMLNAQPIGGKKGTRWRDDVWTMKYLPKFKWRMLTEQIGMSCICRCLHADTKLWRRLLTWLPSISSRSSCTCCETTCRIVSVQTRTTRILEECRACSCTGQTCREEAQSWRGWACPRTDEEAEGRKARTGEAEKSKATTRV